MDLELRGDAAGELSDEVLGRLTYRGSEFEKVTCVLPMPETLKIDYPHLGTVPDRPFAEMVESRWRLGQPQNPSLARLHTVHIHFVVRKEHKVPDFEDDRLMPETLERLQKLQQDGMHFSCIEE